MVIMFIPDQLVDDHPEVGDSGIAKKRRSEGVADVVGVRESLGHQQRMSEILSRLQSHVLSYVGIRVAANQDG